MKKKIYSGMKMDLIFILDEIVRTSPAGGGSSDETPPVGGDDLFG